MLGCDRCKSSCCGYKGNTRDKVITILRGERGSDIRSENYFQEMPLVDNKCQFLREGNQCSIYMDTLRPYTCKLYPFTIDENNYLYLSTTCPDFGKVIDRIMKRDPETIEWVRTNKIVAEKVPFELKKFWGNQIRTNRSVVVWINTEAT